LKEMKKKAGVAAVFGPRKKGAAVGLLSVMRKLGRPGEGER
jgi:hypothetical protein